MLVTASVTTASPGIVYSTFLGGTGNEAAVPTGGGAVALAVDGSGNRYVTGTTQSADFPTTPGADGTLDGTLDVFVTKLGPDGAPVYSTYLGGPCDDWARDIAVDAAGNAYVTGRAGSNCFFGGTSGVLVAKLAPDGSVVYAVVFGGTLADTSSGQAIAVDALGQAHVTGTVLTSSHDFPTTPGAYRTQACANVYSFAADVFVAKLSEDGGSLLYSTIVCGNGDDVPSGIALDASGNAYVGGTTASTGFPTVHALQPSSRAGAVGVTGFVFELTPDGSALTWSTYLGGSGGDTIQGIAIDAERNVYVTGETQSDDFPTTAGVVQERAGPRHCIETCTDAFVAKIAPDGAALVYSTYLSGDLDDAGFDIAVDAVGHASVVGTTASLYFPVVGAFQTTNHGLADAFVTTLAPDATRILFSSYLGGTRPPASIGTGWDEGWAIAVDAAGRMHVGGYTQSYDFPTTPDAAQPILGGGVCDYFGTPCGDAFVTTIDATAAGPVPPVGVDATPTEVPPGGIVRVTWAGIAVPTGSDMLRVCGLGAASDAFCEVTTWWPTGAAAGGTLEITLPADLAAGWYDVRLLSPDPDSWGMLVPIGRSEPIRVTGGAATTTSTVPTTSTTTSTTTPPPGTGCEVAGASVCDQGDPCVVDSCVPGVGCVSTPRSGFESVTCTCHREDPSACPALPSPIARRRRRACGLIATAAATAKPAAAARRLRKGARAVAATMVSVRRASDKGTISHRCAEELTDALRDTQDRLHRLSTSPAASVGASDVAARRR